MSILEKGTKKYRGISHKKSPVGREWRALPHPRTRGQRDDEAPRSDCRAVSAVQWLVGQLEIYRDLRLNLDWFAVEQVRLVLPLLDGICRGFGEVGISAQNLYVTDVAGFWDCCPQFPGTLPPHP